MEVIEITIPYKHKDIFRIFPLGDIHAGSIHCNEKMIKEEVSLIKRTPMSFWIGMGDYIDAINYTDPRFDPKTVAKKYLIEGDIDKMIQMQINDIVDLLHPIKHKCIGLLRGNHEETIRKYYH